MSQQITKIKTRIHSVSSALKVTSAMKLVSTAKLKKWKNKMLANREFSSSLDDIVASVLKYAKKAKTPFTQENSGVDKNLFIIISSTLGLCGSYNANIFRLADINLRPEDDAIILGGKGISHFENGNFTKIDDFSNYSSINDQTTITKIAKYAMEGFIKKQYREIHLIYTHYVNSLAFTPKDCLILPLTKKEEEINPLDAPILEPDEKTLVNTLVPIYIQSTIYAKFLESEVCEQASRSNAMENATDNAKEILETLQIEFNKARQGAITQEIIEVVGAAEAL